MLANLPPQVGFYSCIFPILIYAVLGSSRTLAVGPVGLMSLMVGATIAEMDLIGDPKALTVAVSLSFLSGLILLAMRAIRLGVLTNFISHPVISGFTSAAAIIIGLSQIKHLLGIDLAAKGNSFQQLVTLMEKLDSSNLHTVAIGVFSLTLMMIIRIAAFRTFLNRRLAAVTVDVITKSGPLIAIVLSTALVWHFRIDENAGVSVVGHISAGLPQLAKPDVDFELWKQILSNAIFIAIVGFLESVSVAKALASRKRQKIDANQELIALGAANLGASFSGGYPVAGGFGRSMVNFTSGANTPLASIVTVIIVILSLLFLVPFLYYLPQSVLSAIIIVAVGGLVDVKTFRHVWSYDKTEALCLMATFFAVLIIGIEPGIVFGVAVSVSFHLYRSSEPHIAIVGRIGHSEHFRNVDRHVVSTNPRVILMRIDENLYFANANYLEERIMSVVADNGCAQHLVLICSSVNFIDSTALELLDTLIGRLSDAGVTLYLAEVKGPVMDRLKSSHFIKTLGEDKVFLSTHQAVLFLDDLTNNL